MIKNSHIIATPPGATIKEKLNDEEITQKELASRMEMSEKQVSELINGEIDLTPEIAMKLESILGVPASYWCSLEIIYRAKLQEIVKERFLNAGIYIID